MSTTASICKCGTTAEYRFQWKRDSFPQPVTQYVYVCLDERCVDRAFKESGFPLQVERIRE